MAAKRNTDYPPSDVSLVDVERSSKRRRLLIPHRRPTPRVATSFDKLPADYPTTSFTTIQLNAFAELMKNPLIKAFHVSDACNMSSDRYLLAMVFAYFVRANLTVQEYTVFNFFCALYLAHDIAEECDDYKWEMLPWALGKEWATSLKHFIRKKNEMWCKMRNYAMVSKRLCYQLFGQIERRFSQVELRLCPMIIRERDELHGDVIMQTRRMLGSNEEHTGNTSKEKVNYQPKGPIWNHGPIDQAEIVPCKMCQKQIPISLLLQYKTLFEEAEQYQTTIQIPESIVLSQGLDIGSDDSETESTLSFDSEEEWKPSKLPNSAKSAGRTGRPMNLLNCHNQLRPTRGDDMFNNDSQDE